MTRFCALSIVALLMIAATGCMQFPAGVTCSTLPITAKDAYTVIGPAEGSDSTLGILYGGIFPYSAYNAIQDAKTKSGGDGLINVTAETKQFWLTVIAPFVTWNTITVRGDAIKFKRDAKQSS